MTRPLKDRGAVFRPLFGKKDERFPIAIDAMGGQYAPQAVIAAVLKTHQDWPHVVFRLFGKQEQLLPLLPQKREYITIIDVQDVISDYDKPSVALRQGKKSSMYAAILDVKKGRSNAILSSGNTGALVAMSKILLGTLPGVHRPAIIGFLPNEKGFSSVIDLGANVQCDSQNLLQFAIMGALFFRVVTGKKMPTVSLLNVGEETGKGIDSVREAHNILEKKKLSLPFRYNGFAEGNEVLAGAADVFVTDGFTGNIGLKLVEGTGHFVATALKEVFSSSLVGKIVGRCALPYLQSFQKICTPSQYNGGMLIGLNGISVKSHGGSSEEGIKSALEVVLRLVSFNILGKLRENLTLLEVDDTTTSTPS